MAYCSKYVDNIDNRYTVIIGDGETAEGQVWEAATFASFYKLDNIVAFLDVNRYGQSTVCMFEHDVENYRAKFQAFGWNTITIDGHDVAEVILALEWAKQNKGAPSIIIAKTYKGKNLSENIENKDWHGKPLGEYHDAAVAYLKSIIKDPKAILPTNKPEKTGVRPEKREAFKIIPNEYPKGKNLIT